MARPMNLDIKRMSLNEISKLFDEKLLDKLSEKQLNDLDLRVIELKAEQIDDLVERLNECKNAMIDDLKAKSIIINHADSILHDLYYIRKNDWRACSNFSIDFNAELTSRLEKLTLHYMKLY